MAKTTEARACSSCEIMYVPVLPGQSICWNCKDGFFMNKAGDQVISKTVADQSTILFLIGQGMYEYIVQKMDPANYNLN